LIIKISLRGYFTFQKYSYLEVILNDQFSNVSRYWICLLNFWLDLIILGPRLSTIFSVWIELSWRNPWFSMFLLPHFKWDWKQRCFKNLWKILQPCILMRKFIEFVSINSCFPIWPCYVFVCHMVADFSSTKPYQGLGSSQWKSAGIALIRYWDWSPALKKIRKKSYHKHLLVYILKFYLKIK
jgi:hypothetical protein